MVLPRVNRHHKYPGDQPGPFEFEGRRLRVLVDFPRELRQHDEWAWGSNQLNSPESASFCWSLGGRDDIEFFWVGEPSDPDEAGRVLLEQEPHHDYLGFTTTGENGIARRAIYPYSTFKDAAVRDAPQVGLTPEEWLRQILIAQVCMELRADLFVTVREQSLTSRAWYIAEANPILPEHALAVMGLYLRTRKQYPVVAPNKLSFNEHLLLLVAARALLPSWWPWAQALGMHSRHVGNDSPQLLAGTLRERIVRVLRCRDQVHAASLAPQTNTTADRATEALDYLLVNLVGAFDAAARVAHLCAGLPPTRRHLAGWQKMDWLSSLRNSDLKSHFAKSADAAERFAVCRMLRNTVHGESLQTISLQESGNERQTLVRLPQDDADELAEMLDRLGGHDVWGLRSLYGTGMFVDAAVFVERLLPQALTDLDYAIRLTPTKTLSGVDQAALAAPPPHSTVDGTGAQIRACLLLGLPRPAA